MAHAAIRSLPFIGFNYGRLERQPDVSLGPQPSREDQCHLTLSLEHYARSVPTALPSGLRNTVVIVSHLVAQRTIPSSTNNEFMGMIESITKSLHGLLAEGPGSNSGSDSNRGSHHPSRGMFHGGYPGGTYQKRLHGGGYPGRQPRW